MRVLLIDTCGDVGSVALAGEANIIASEETPLRAASSALLATIRQLLAQVGWTLSDLHAVGVVGGPGSFTGVRVGLAAAKGLCEARGLTLAAVSRLEVLAEAAGLQRGFAVLEAGRGEVYVRRIKQEIAAEDALYAVSDLLKAARGERVVFAEQRLADKLHGLQPELQTISVKNALPAVLRALASGGSDLKRVEANYVRSEQQIYGKASLAANRVSPA